MNTEELRQWALEQAMRANPGQSVPGCLNDAETILDWVTRRNEQTRHPRNGIGQDAAEWAHRFKRSRPWPFGGLL